MKIFTFLRQKTATSKVPKLKFCDGNEIPMIGLGTWTPPKTNKGQVEEAIKCAIDIGYRHIDCARFYRNEEEVGNAIQRKMSEGVIQREDIFVTSKLWNTEHRPDLVEKALRRTLEELHFEYVNLYLMHWPFALKEGDKLMPKDECGKMLFSNVDYLDTWKAMEKLQECGLAKSIGVSNFNKSQLERLLGCAGILPVNLQIECNPFFNQTKMINFAKSQGLIVTAFSPLGSPGFFKKKLNILEEPKLVEMAKKYDKSPAQIALRYQIERGVIVIPKSVTPERLKSNFDIFDFSICDKADMDILNGMDVGRKGRMMMFQPAFGHPDHPFEKDEY